MYTIFVPFTMYSPTRYPSSTSALRSINRQWIINQKPVNIKIHTIFSPMNLSFSTPNTHTRAEHSISLEKNVLNFSPLVVYGPIGSEKRRVNYIAPFECLKWDSVKWIPKRYVQPWFGCRASSCTHMQELEIPLHLSRYVLTFCTCLFTRVIPVFGLTQEEAIW